MTPFRTPCPPPSGGPRVASEAINLEREEVHASPPGPPMFPRVCDEVSKRLKGVPGPPLFALPIQDRAQPAEGGPDGDYTVGSLGVAGPAAGIATTAQSPSTGPSYPRYLCP